MWKDYIKERENLDTYENETGFLTYEIHDGICFMSDIYVKPEHRGTSAGYKLYLAVKNIAIDSGCTSIRGQIDATTPNWQLSYNLMMRLGFKPYSAQENLTYLQLKLYTVRGT